MNFFEVECKSKSNEKVHTNFFKNVAHIKFGHHKKRRRSLFSFKIFVSIYFHFHWLPKSKVRVLCRYGSVSYTAFDEIQIIFLKQKKNKKNKINDDTSQ